MDKNVKTHWKSLCGTPYLGAWDFEYGEKEKVVVITSIDKKIVVGPGGKEAEKSVATLKDDKPLILNSKKQNVLIELFKSVYIQDWVDKPIILYPMKEILNKKPVDAIGIKKQLPIQETPKELQELTPTHASWIDAKNAVADGLEIEKIEKKYRLTETNKQLLCKK